MARRIPPKPVGVLVVEDSLSQQQLLVALLTRGGFAVVGVVSNGLAAVTTTERLRPDSSS
jgi:CheY-like chemotaxis protein